MKKTGLLNSRLCGIIAEMGHTDTLCIGDAGLPFPKGPEQIDLAITRGVPSFLEVMDAILSELPVEEVTIASEMRINNKALYDAITKIFHDITINEIPHAEFKKTTEFCKAVVRTGECVPYANILLHASVSF